MTIQTLLKMGDPRLLRVAPPVPASMFGSIELAQLLADMRDTMLAANGAGLAAPQIGVNLQLVIFGTGTVSPRYPDELPIPQTVLINPVITPLNGEIASGWEGCLSVPGLRGEVPRWAKVRYQGLDESGESIDRTVDGFHARVVQHEVDHLIGRLYPTRMADLTRLGFTEVLFPELA